MKESGILDKLVDKESSITLMEISTKDSGQTIKPMDMAFTQT